MRWPVDPLERARHAHFVTADSGKELPRRVVAGALLDRGLNQHVLVLCRLLEDRGDHRLLEAAPHGPTAQQERVEHRSGRADVYDERSHDAVLAKSILRVNESDDEPVISAYRCKLGLAAP